MFTSFTEGCVPSTFMVENPPFIYPEDGGGILPRNARLHYITSERTRNVFEWESGGMALLACHVFSDVIKLLAAVHHIQAWSVH
jgi:hypothetical protein